MSEEIDLFLEDLTTRRSASMHTVSNYRLDLERFSDWLTDRGGDWQTLDRRAVRAWVASMHADGYAASSIGRKLSALRSLYRFLVREGRVGASPLLLVPAPEEGEYLTEDPLGR